MSHFRFWMLALAVSVPAVAAPQAVDPESSFNAGLNHLREGRPGMAVEAFRKAVREDGKNPYFQKGLGQAYLASGKYDDVEIRHEAELVACPLVYPFRPTRVSGVGAAGGDFGLAGYRVRRRIRRGSADCPGRDPAWQGHDSLD